MNKEQILARVNKALDTIRPHLQADDGDVAVVELTDDMILKLKWLGTCETCSMSPMTMKAGIVGTIETQVPEIKGVTVVNGLFAE